MSLWKKVRALDANLRGKLLVSSFLLGFFGCDLYVGFSHGEAFPFSSFPMFSSVRGRGTEGHSFVRYEARGETTDGRVLDNIPPPLGYAQLASALGRADRKHGKQRDRLLRAAAESFLAKAEPGLENGAKFKYLELYRVGYTIRYPHPESAQRGKPRRLYRLDGVQ